MAPTEFEVLPIMPSKVQPSHDADTGLDGDELTRPFITRTFGPIAPGSVRGSIFTLASTALGAGMLALPYVLKVAGLVPGILFILVAGIVSLIAMELLVACARITGIKNYAELVRQVLGKRMGDFMELVIVVYCFGCVIGYFVLIGEFVPSMLDAVGLSSLNNRALDMIVLTGCGAFPLALLKNMSSLRYSSIVGLMCIIYINLVVIAEGPEQIRRHSDLPIVTYDMSMEVFKVISITFFAYTCHVNVFSVYSELQNPLARRMHKVTRRATLVEIIVYSSIAIFGYLSFRDLCDANITKNYGQDDWFMNVGVLGMAFTLVMAIPLNMHPLRSNLNNMIFKTQDVSVAYHVATTFCLVASALTLAIFLPSIKTVFSLLGGSCCIFICYFMPGWLYVKLSPNPWFSPANLGVCFLVCVCSIIGCISTALSLKEIFAS
eukprot:GILJ01006933.1.p1 GENE.GILJ01006933.1~~GILJ01006933.1.p1  ORF type:complete len:449 (+),score=63.75 GILJ01006933.1:44-1348(+)